MKRCRHIIRIVTGAVAVAMLAAMVLTVTPAVSSQAASAAAATVTKHSGSWHVSGCAVLCGRSVATDSYSAYDEAETCIDITSEGHPISGEWTLYLRWVDAGNDIVLFQLTGAGTGTYCSGWRTMSHPDDKVFDEIYATSGESISGTYNIWTN